MRDGEAPRKITLWGRSMPAIASVERKLAWEQAMLTRHGTPPAAGPRAIELDGDSDGDVQVVGLDSAPPSPRRPGAAPAPDDDAATA